MPGEQFEPMPEWEMPFGKEKPVENQEFEEFQSNWERHRAHQKTNPDGKTVFEKTVEEYPTEIPESWTPKEGRPMTRHEMEAADIKAKKEKLN